MHIEHTIFSEDSLLLNSRFKLQVCIEDPQCISSSSPVEKFHDACHPSGGSLGVAVPTTFSALDDNCILIRTNDREL